MEMIVQPNKWSCGATSLAMLLDMSYNGVISLLGHDGSEVVNPELPEQLRHRGFSLDELIDIAYQRSVALIPIEATLVIKMWRGVEHTYTPARDYGLRFGYYLKRHSGLILLNAEASYSHVVAWDHETERVFNPDGGKLQEINDPAIGIDAFYAAIPF